ncbi:hypothetical protein D3C72_1645180 [compost metagenome]
MIADPQHWLLRQLPNDADLERQGIAQRAHEQLRPALTALSRGRDAQRLIEGEQRRHSQAKQYHQYHPQDACEDAQALHQTAALKWRA